MDVLYHLEEAHYTSDLGSYDCDAKSHVQLEKRS